MKILLADDDRVLTTLLSGRLRPRGVEVVVAHDALQALMSAMRSPPDARTDRRPHCGLVWRARMGGGRRAAGR
ncbi:MAG TPA: hypothetical protein VNC19_01560 [Gemmatimonadales bacterium]|nr:hypothetical protein [Gemmatimonadales bacterium]